MLKEGHTQKKICLADQVLVAVLPHRTFLKVLYFFFTISRFCTFFVLFSGHVLFLYFFFISLAEFYQILFKSTFSGDFAK